MADDYYKILGVSKSATPEEIRKAYKKMAQKYHPDLNPDDKAAHSKFKEIQNAYDVIGDAEKRKKYDQFGSNFENMGAGPGPGGGGPGGFHQWRSAGGGPGGGQFEFDLGDLFGGGGGPDLSDIFGGMGGGGGRRRHAQPVRGNDLQHDVTVPFKQAMEGGEINLNVRRPGGEMERLTAKIPPGIEDGKKIRLRGQGDPGPNGGPAGDLLIKIHVQSHKYFKRNGKDLEVTVPVSLAEAMLGGSIDVPTPGGTVTMKIPAGSSSGKRLRVRGQGVPSASGDAGDLYVVLQIALPEKPTEELKQAVEKYAEDHAEDPRKDLSWQRKGKRVTEKSHRFPPQLRLKTPTEFDVVFKRRASAGNGWMVVYAARNSLGVCRMGMVVAKKKIGNAVQRNRWKRRLREAFRLNREKLPGGFDFVVLPQSKKHPSFEDLEHGLVQLAHRSARKWKRNNSPQAPPPEGQPSEGRPRG